MFQIVKHKILIKYQTSSPSMNLTILWLCQWVPLPQLGSANMNALVDFASFRLNHFTPVQSGCPNTNYTKLKLRLKISSVAKINFFYSLKYKINITFSKVRNFCLITFLMFNRPGVARAVLRTPLSLIHSLINWWFVEIFSRLVLTCFKAVILLVHVLMLSVGFTVGD